uniref:Uncharacterized protein n=1 Tax=Chromera velia CCMP2878 TaxID=1169474 RepID=A0A0K6S9Y7_9ALVE|eukprot:Cvel_9094.t2-p1 / transcript=Cvel_9094.t2 / gene=Cvel_9094 / organism=Chromera_velia_CCMP2878 / gene_product=hypothetical protein / transcript_product=hypothetical protein / location=Cvel_scaffold516:38935-41059(-) / protein_length=139 / sequence_SO=supercontig / SO=protein_coding / is_pseudo=false
MASLFNIHFALCFLWPFLRLCYAVCYLTGDGDCAVCWMGMGAGTTAAVQSAPMACPAGIQLVWDTPPPATFHEDETPTYRYDLAIGRSIEVLPAVVGVIAEGYITLGVVCGVGVLLIGGFSWMVLRSVGGSVGGWDLFG